MNTPGSYMKPGLEAKEHPTIRDIAWAAGIYEGEGSCTNNSGKGHKCEKLRVCQSRPWILEKLKLFFGGSMYEVSAKHVKGGRMWVWQVNGARARGVMYTLFSFLSPYRKQQIIRALGR